MPEPTPPIWSALREWIAGRVAAVGGRPLEVIDLGGGTGELAVPLAQLGCSVTVIDPSADALAALARRAAEAQVAAQITAVQADATELSLLADLPIVDLACCHGVLEYVADPGTAVAELAAGLAPGGALSVLVAQRSGAVVSRAWSGRFSEATTALAAADGRWGSDDPLPRRFDLDEVSDLLVRAGLAVEQAVGVRLFSSTISAAAIADPQAQRALAQLEHLLGPDPRFRPLAPQLQLLAVRAVV
jgi:S-adenosylmethionine-dependent methyltransferase